ncbi:MAG: dicarboxylate/amino acid:cation symporter [Romboutsia sp.]|nr:dicarboxylate/amino acid:cation symporter [Romboutsia sp.]
MKKILESYKDSIKLLLCIAIGGIAGVLLGDKAVILKPFGDLFLNLMFMILVPLVFFSVVSAITGMKDMNRLGKTLKSVTMVFLGTSIIIAIISLPIGLLLNPTNGVDVSGFKELLDVSSSAESNEQISFLTQLVNAVTVSDFSQLLTRSNMLQLIVASIFVGIAIASCGSKTETITKVIDEITLAIMKLVDIIMLYAPIGLGCYFASVIGDLGGQLLSIYIKAFIGYTLTCIVFYIVFYSLCAFISAGKEGVKELWKGMISPTITSIATCSSAASIPSNLKSVKEIGVPVDIAEIVVPLGANIQKHGSVISCLFKALLLFVLFRPEDLYNPSTLISILCVSILASVVMGAIPGGGMLGEMLVVTSFGFGAETLPIIFLFGTIVDMPATMLNVTGDIASSMLVARMVEGKNWIKK